MTGVSGYKITEIDTKEIANKQASKIVARKSEQIIKLVRVESIEKQPAESYIRDQSLLIDSLFVPTPAPYPEMLTQTVEPSAQFKPKIERIDTGDRKLVSYEMYAGGRLNYGVRTWDLVKYRAILEFVYFKQGKQLYQVELFTPVSRFNQRAKQTVRSLKLR